MHGEEVTICGEPDEVTLSGDWGRSTRPHYLNYGGHYPHQDITIVIWPSDMHDLELRPRMLRHARCYTGTVDSYYGRVQIKVSRPEQLSAMPTTP